MAVLSTDQRSIYPNYRIGHSSRRYLRNKDRFVQSYVIQMGNIEGGSLYTSLWFFIVVLCVSIVMNVMQKSFWNIPGSLDIFFMCIHCNERNAKKHLLRTRYMGFFRFFSVSFNFLVPVLHTHRQYFIKGNSHNHMPDESGRGLKNAPSPSGLVAY